MNYLHPWNLSTLAVGVGLLVAGAYYYEAPDWDVPISFIMAGFTYLTAAWSLQVVFRRQWGKLPLALGATWWAVDGCYALYWYFRNPEALAMMRDANWTASLALYWACAVVWSLPDFVCEFRSARGV